MAESVRIDRKAHEKLSELARKAGASITETLSRAIEAYEAELFWKQLERGYAELRSDPNALREESEERALFEQRNVSTILRRLVS
jgi:hypothetical protein